MGYSYALGNDGVKPLHGRFYGRTGKGADEGTDRDGLVARIGIEECFPGKYDDMIDSNRGFQWLDLNVMLEKRLQ